MPSFASAVVDWYAANARDLPWRRTTDPWAVLVSEVMLQQTPVARVLPAYAAWLDRWPAPSALADDAPGEAVRMWGRLGYPRRALRLHAAATSIRDRHSGAVPADLDDLLALPGIGAYTARAVASFAFGQRHAVVDTNVRRVVARAITGHAHAGPPSTARDLATVEKLLPQQLHSQQLQPQLNGGPAPDGAARGGTGATRKGAARDGAARAAHDETTPDGAARFGVAVMELGALVCTARAPRCGDCPVAATCAWRLAGCPPYDGPRAPRQAFEGTDRQARGALLAVVRDAVGPVDVEALERAWAEPLQRARALDGLVADGLVEPTEDGRFGLPA